MTTQAAGSNDREDPPLKRPRTINQVTQTSQLVVSSLKRMLDLPPEVFNEIVANIMPSDLLSLARSNKFFRKMFMSRSAIHLWQKALNQISGLPPCPSDLCEPQYASLLFSETCSVCGEKVHRRMDPYLHVRLCNLCWNKETTIIGHHDRYYSFVPRSEGVGTKDGYLYTLRIEVEKYEEHEKDKQTISIWAEARFEEMEKWHKHSEELEIYLDKIDRDRELELEVLKAQRSDEIKLRLLEKGWTKRETEPSPQNLADWNRLVLQPKPLTDQIWNDLYPKLVPLLASNRIYYEHIDKEQRRRDRIARIDDLVITIRQASPPLIHVAPKGPLGSEDTSKPITSHDFSQHAPGSNFDDSGVEVEMPFPSIIELLTWPMINHLIEDDTSPEDVETKFNQIRKEFDQAVIKWRREVEQDLVNIWNAACIQHGEDMIKTRSSTESKGKAVAREDARSNTHTDKELAPTIQSLPAETLRHSLELPLPEFIFTFAKPDGTTTTDISSLSPNVQILLRTDATFNCSYFRSSYPAIIPDPTIPIDEVSEKKMLKERWRVKSVTQDVEGLTVIKALLTQMGRANATGAEMNAIGARFRCGQCVQILPQTWKQMVFHYVEEQSKWKQVQKKTKENSKSSFPFHNTHDLRHLNTKPFVHLMSPQAAAELANESVSHSMQEMMCKPCKSMGVEARYLHTSEVGAESPMVHHLHNEHDIHHDTPGTHFVPWRPVNLEHLIFGSSEPSDEENPDSNHDFIWDDD